MPLRSVDYAVVFYAVGKPCAVGCKRAEGVTVAVAAIVLFGIEVQGLSVLDMVDAVGGTGQEVGIGVCFTEKGICGSGVLAVGLAERNAVA